MEDRTERVRFFVQIGDEKKWLLMREACIVFDNGFAKNVSILKARDPDGTERGPTIAELAEIYGTGINPK